MRYDLVKIDNLKRNHISMLLGNELDRRLATFPAQPLTGEGFLTIGHKRIPEFGNVCDRFLNKTFRRSRRYNTTGQRTIYLASSSDRLFQVCATNLYILPQPNLQKTLTVLRFEYSLNSVLDLTDTNIQSQLNTNLQELTPKSRIQRQQTQSLGNAVRKANFAALKVPVDTVSDGYYIVIFREKLSTQNTVKCNDIPNNPIQIRANTFEPF